MDPRPEWHCRIGRVTRKGGATVRVLPFPAPAPSQAAIDLVSGLLERLKSGECVAAAIVDVSPDGGVGTGWSKSQHHHLLTSGAATLAWRLARS